MFHFVCFRTPHAIIQQPLRVRHPRSRGDDVTRRLNATSSSRADARPLPSPIPGSPDSTSSALLSFSSHSSSPHHTTASSPASLFPVTAPTGLDAAHRLISRSGRDCGDKDPWSIAYLGFLEETLSVFEALGGPMQALRAARIAASPDFISSQRYDRTAPMPELRTSKSKTSPPRRTVPASRPATRMRRSD